MIDITHIPKPFRYGVRSAVLFSELSSDDNGLGVGAWFANEDRTLMHGASNTMCRDTQNKDERKSSSLRKHYIPHAEIHLISKLARKGVKTAGGTLYTTVPPCAQCANSIVAAGITTVVIGGGIPYAKNNYTWESIQHGFKILSDNHVAYHDFTLTPDMQRLLYACIEGGVVSSVVGNKLIQGYTLLGFGEVDAKLAVATAPLLSVEPDVVYLLKQTDKALWYIERAAEVNKDFNICHQM